MRLQGRRWPQLKSLFEELWSITLRAMDDIKESVRAAAATLLRSVRGLTLRLCDPAATPAADAAEATAVALPLLLQKGAKQGLLDSGLVCWRCRGRGCRAVSCRHKNVFC